MDSQSIKWRSKGSHALPLGFFQRTQDTSAEIFIRIHGVDRWHHSRPKQNSWSRSLFRGNDLKCAAAGTILGLNWNLRNSKQSKEIRPCKGFLASSLGSCNYSRAWNSNMPSRNIAPITPPRGSAVGDNLSQCCSVGSAAPIRFVRFAGDWPAARGNSNTWAFLILCGGPLFLRFSPLCSCPQG